MGVSVSDQTFSIPIKSDNKASDLTKREYFALQCLVGYLSSGRRDTVKRHVIVTLAQAALMEADALIAELNKE